MEDPELHSDERILIRTEGIHVKSISFEAILTNKRIILVDKLKNILPPKEIQLATIQTIEAGENAIRETVITLAAVTKEGRTRRMVLTFSREGGGNRAKERNEWIRLINENITPSFEQITRTGIPALDPAEKSGSVPSPRFRNVGSQLPPTRYEQATQRPSEKKVDETPLVSWQAPSPASESILGTYCTRCGTKVPEGSGFCNNCGSRIMVPREVPQIPVVIPTPVTSVPTVKTERPIDHLTQSRDTLIEHSSVKVPQDSPHAIPPESAFVPETQPAVAPAAAQPQKRFMSRFFSPKERSPPSRVPKSMPTEKPRSRKKRVLALVIIIVIIIAVVAVAVVLPKLRSTKSILPEFNNSGTSTTAPTPTITVAHATTTRTTVPVTTEPIGEQQLNMAPG
jgi:hypothetical protein